MLEICQLQQLLSVAEYGTLSAAAEAIHLSQPSLSRSMKKIEEDLRVTLFDRQKNKITLNENGKLAVECARKVLDQLQQMESQVRSFDRSRRTILVGSCAPAPLWTITPALSDLYPDMTISSEMRDSEVLLRGLREGIYQLIVLPCQMEEDGLSCVKYEEEHLFFSLPPAHPLSGCSALHLSDMNGETMLLRNRLGFWNSVAGGKMADTRVLVQEDFAFNELVKSSALPCFTSDLAIRREGTPPNRVNIPILDEEANVTYYCLYRPEEQQDLSGFFQSLRSEA